MKYFYTKLGKVAVESLPYRDFYYPLNVFMHILKSEEGDVSYLHYGLFERDDESFAAAQERSTDLLMSRLSQPPAKLLDVGTGLGTTLNRLISLGYTALGITPDEKQIALIARRFGDTLRVQQIAFEQIEPQPFDTVIFQESSQYIQSDAIFAKAETLTSHVIVLDEFAITDGTLHRYDGFVAAARDCGFRLTEEIDLSRQAAPTVDYFNTRLPRYRDRLVRDLGLTNQKVDDLIASGDRYRALYQRGSYVYRLLQFHR